MLNFTCVFVSKFNVMIFSVSMQQIYKLLNYIKKMASPSTRVSYFSKIDLSIPIRVSHTSTSTNLLATMVLVNPMHKNRRLKVIPEENKTQFAPFTCNGSTPLRGFKRLQSKETSPKQDKLQATVLNVLKNQSINNMHQVSTAPYYGLHSISTIHLDFCYNHLFPILR